MIHCIHAFVTFGLKNIMPYCLKERYSEDINKLQWFNAMLSPNGTRGFQHIITSPHTLLWVLIKFPNHKNFFLLLTCEELNGLVKLLVFYDLPPLLGSKVFVDTLNTEDYSKGQRFLSQSPALLGQPSDYCHYHECYYHNEYILSILQSFSFSFSYSLSLALGVHMQLCWHNDPAWFILSSHHLEKLAPAEDGPVCTV